MKNNIRILYGMSFLQGMVFYASVATLYRTSAGLSLFQISLIESISYVFTIAFELPWGILADRIGYRKTMVICSFLFFLSKIVFWLAADFPMFLLERILISIVISGLSGVDTSILYLSADGKNSQRIFGIYGALGTAGMILASLVCALWIGSDYRLAGFLTIFPYAAAAVLSLFLSEVHPDHTASRPNRRTILAALKETLQNRRLLCLVIGAGLMSETVHMLTVFLNQPKYTATGMDAHAISLVYVLMTLLGLLQACSSRLTGRLGSRKAGTLLFAAAGAASLLLAWTGRSVSAVISIAVIEISYSLFQPLFQAREHDSIHAADRATAISMAALFMDLTAVIVDLVMGRIADSSLSASILAGTVFLAAGLVCFRLGQPSAPENSVCPPTDTL